MAKYASLLADALAAAAVGNGPDTDENGWFTLPPSARNAVLPLEGSGGAAFTVEVETRSLTGAAVPYHTEVFTENKVVPLVIGDLPFTPIRVRLSAYTDGALSAPIHYTA